MAGKIYAGLDIGSSRVKLAFFDESFNQARLYTAPAPRGSRPHRHSPRRLLDILAMAARKASKMGARGLGLSLYRASVAAWTPGGEPLSEIYLWTDRASVEESVRRLPPLAGLARKLPILGQVLSGASPLPLISLLLASNPGARVWSIDALVMEHLGAGFRSVASIAATTGSINPWSLKTLRPVTDLVGLPPKAVPEVVGEAGLWGVLEGVAITAVVGDQQADLVGSGCIEPGCLKLSLGTGGFVDAPLSGKPPLPRGGVVPIIVHALGQKPLWGVESMVPGLGPVFEGVSEMVGGFKMLGSLATYKCGSWPPEGLVIAVRRGLGWSAVAVAPEAAISKSILVCGLLAGSALSLSALVERVSSVAGAPRRVVAVGGLTRLAPLVDAIALASGTTIESFPRLNAAARGAAMLAAVGVGDIDVGDLTSFTPEPGTIHEGGSGWDLKLWRDVEGVIASKSFWRKLEELLAGRT